MTSTILESSFGYDMTINCYYMVLQDGTKTALVQEIGKTVSNDDGMGGGNSIPDTSKRLGKPFRAYKRDYTGRPIYVSKYIAGNSADEWSGKPSYYNTWD